MEVIAMLYLGTRGAGPAYAFEMTKSISNSHKVVCIVSEYAENINTWKEEALINKNIELHTFKTYKGIIGFVLSLFKFNVFNKIADIIKDSRPMAIYIPMGHFWDCRILSKTHDIKIIKTIHDVHLHTGEDGITYRIVNLLFEHKSDGYVVLSDQYIAELSRQRNVPENKVCCIPHASFKSYGFSTNLDEKQYNKILFFGRIIKYKGIDVLLEAFKELKDSDLRLMIAGHGDFSPYEKAAKDIPNLELKLGWIKDDDIKHLFDDVDAIVLPYVNASQSGVIPLAYSFGKPVIVTNIGALASQVEDGETGFVIPVNDPVVLAKAIKKIYASSEKLVNMKKAAFDYSNNNSWDKSADKLIRFINQINHIDDRVNHVR